MIGHRPLAGVTVAAIGLAVFNLPTTASAVELWGIRPTENEIVRVDPATGITFNRFTPPGGALTPDQLFGGLTIAEGGRVLLYQNPVTNPTDLFRLDPNSGALLSTEFMPAADTMPEYRAGLSYQTGAGAARTDAVFAVNDGSPVQRQDGYGNPVLVDHFGGAILFAGALGGDDQGRAFVAVDTQIVEFDPANENVQLNAFNSPLQNDVVTGLAFDGTYVYLAYSGGSLFTLDPETGAVVNNVQVLGRGDTTLIGLAARIPEPSTGLLALVAAGLVIAVWPR